MILYPAIDLKDGLCVRLVRGDMAQATVFNRDPADQARKFAAAGAAWIHVVDLDGAFAGKPKNAAAVDAILKSAKARFNWAAASATAPPSRPGSTRASSGWCWARRRSRTPIWSKRPAANSPAASRWASMRAKARWRSKAGRKASSISALDLARRFADAGAAAIVYTDIERDGALQGVNLEATAELARAVKTPVIASGGIASLDDIAALKAEGHSGRDTGTMPL